MQPGLLEVSDHAQNTPYPPSGWLREVYLEHGVQGTSLYPEIHNHALSAGTGLFPAKNEVGLGMAHPDRAQNSKFFLFPWKT